MESTIIQPNSLLTFLSTILGGIAGIMNAVVLAMLVCEGLLYFVCRTMCNCGRSLSYILLERSANDRDELVYERWLQQNLKLMQQSGLQSDPFRPPGHGGASEDSRGQAYATAPIASVDSKSDSSGRSTMQTYSGYNTDDISLDSLTSTSTLSTS